MEKVLVHGKLADAPPPPVPDRALRRQILFVVVSVLLHLSIAAGLREVTPARHENAEAEPARIEFEVVQEAAPARTAPPPPAPVVREQPAQPQTPAQAAPKQIVELPEAPEQAPDKPSYLAERDMRAEEETLARKLGEATNQRQDGAAPQKTDPRAMRQDGAEDAPKPALEARPGQAGPGRERAGETQAVPSVQAGSELSDIQGDGVELPAGARDGRAETARAERGGGQAGSRPMSPPSLLPTQNQLAKLVEPAQRNLLEAKRGDVTLLNARSSEMAKYVIARAKRIYSFLNINAPMLTVYYEDVRGMHFPVAVDAILDRQGKILGVETVATSGSGKIDRLVIDSARAGLQNQGPPPAEAFTGGDTFRFRFALFADHIEAGTP